MTTARTAVLAFWVAGMALAQPPLTTIQDVLYKADGTRFNGIAIITWTSFESANTSNIATQSITVKIVDGNLRVQLVSTTDANPASFYSVTYNGDGKVQFQETWNVPPSMTPLRVRDVRGSVTQTNPLEPPSQTPILESDVVGLVNDLSLRPSKGPGFGVGRAAVINANGGIETVSGDPGDCVKVDGTSGPCSGGAGPAFIDSEALGGIVDGGNAVFTTSNAPNPPASLALYRNGILQKVGFDYTLTGSTVTYLTGAIPQPADTLLASYRLGGTPGSQPQFPSAQVICSAAGTATSASAFASLGTCTIPQGVLQSGDRLDIRFDLAHQGTTAGFEFLVLWGATVVVDRSGVAGDVMVAGRGEAGIYGAGTQLRAETWGTLLGIGVGVADASDSIVTPLTVDFQAKMLTTTLETISLRNFSVIRYPAQSNP